MISLTATKTTINKKYGEGGWMGSSFPLRHCSGLRRIGGGPLQTGTNDGGGAALEDDNVEDDEWKTTTTDWEVEDCRQLTTRTSKQEG